MEELILLMSKNKVTGQEIQQAVASRGYYSVSTPIDRYDPGFIAFVLIGAWPQIFKLIRDNRQKEEKPGGASPPG